jgi:hypothetical protein
MITINQAVPEKMDKPGYDKFWALLQHTEFFAATHDGYVRYQQAKHRRHIVFAKNRYWLIIDKLWTAGKNQEMDFNLHTPCSMKEINDGYISIQDNGFLIKQDHLDASNIVRIKSVGGASLGELPNEPSHRDIDWLVFRKQLSGDSRSDRMATLIYPFSAKENLVPVEASVEKLDMKDDAVMGYLVRTKNREDIIIVSDGKYRIFTDKIQGDFKFGLISYTAGRVDYAGISSVGKYWIDSVGQDSFKSRRDYEYQK